MKILMVTNKVKTYALGFQNMVDPLKQLGHEIIWAADFSGFAGDLVQIPCKTVQIPIHSNPLKTSNFQALRKLKKIIADEKIEAVQCSTPIGGMLARLAAKQMGVKKVIYAAHGFLFFKGAPLLNRTVYYWQEKWMAAWTDTLITITDEDLQTAQKFKLRSGKKPYLVHGAGVEVGKTVEIDRSKKREELGLPDEAFVMISAGFLNKNKNNRVLIEAMGALNDPCLHYLVCGDGEELETLKNLAVKCGVEKNVHFLNYRTDLAEIMVASDLFAMPSWREGVPRALLEAMDLGLPCIGSDTRGIRELLSNGRGGVLCRADDATAFAEGIKKLKSDVQLCDSMHRLNKEVAKTYSKERVRQELLEIYSRELR